MRNPLALPVEVISALRVLPDIARHTRKMSRSMDGLRRDTAELQKLAADASVLVPMDKRVAAIEGAMPVLVEVQQHLALVPETLGRLDERMTRLAEGLDQLLVALEDLSKSVEGLQRSVQPLGRIARRLPGGSKQDDKRAAEPAE
jgi:uncharacterized protein YoxC